MSAIDYKNLENNEDQQDRNLSEWEYGRSRMSRNPFRRLELQHWVGGFMIAITLVCLGFLFFMVPPTHELSPVPSRSALEKRVDKGTVRLTMIGTGLAGINTIGGGIGSKSVGQGLLGGLVTILSAIVIKLSGTSAATQFFGYTKRQHTDDKDAVFTINGVSPHDTAAWANLHRTYDVKFPFQRHDIGTRGWVMFHHDKSTTMGHVFNVTREPDEVSDNDLAIRETGCVATNTCSDDYQAEVIMTYNDPGGAAPEDEEWDNDDWSQIAQSIVDQLQAANGDKANFEIDNPFGIVLTGSLECDSA